METGVHTLGFLSGFSSFGMWPVPCCWCDGVGPGAPALLALVPVWPAVTGCDLQTSSALRGFQPVIYPSRTIPLLQGVSHRERNNFPAVTFGFVSSEVCLCAGSERALCCYVGRGCIFTGALQNVFQKAQAYCKGIFLLKDEQRMS